jgi:hypothetical protein
VLAQTLSLLAASRKLPTPVLSGSGPKGLSQPRNLLAEHPCFIGLTIAEMREKPNGTARPNPPIYHYLRWRDNFPKAGLAGFLEQ